MDFFSRERFPMFTVIETVFTEYTAPTVSDDCHIRLRDFG